jgi:nucleoside phosphorylase
MSAVVSRTRDIWRCPNGDHESLAPRKRTCPVCGAKLQKTTESETRSIMWSGFMSPELLGQALSFDALRRERQVMVDEATLAGFFLDKEQALSDSTTDALILTALPKELEAVLTNSGPWSRESDATTGLQYHLTSAYNGLRIAAMGMTAIGPVSAAVTASQAIEIIRPSRLLLVGICAGISPDVQLGDVCVSEQIVDYDLGKIRDGSYTPRWRAFPSDAALVRASKYLRDQSWSKSITTRRPDGSPLKPSVHIGTILSGSKVVADTTMVDALRAVWSQAVGLEMEGGGTAAAAHEHHTHPGLILIKGVCDHANAEKSDDWQAYAADAAGRYAISLLIDAPPSESLALARRPTASDRPGVHPAPHIVRDEFHALGLTRTDALAMLSTSFNILELKKLCYDLSLEWENIEDRETKIGAAMSIIGTFARRHELRHLIEYIHNERPGLLGHK